MSKSKLVPISKKGVKKYLKQHELDISPKEFENITKHGLDFVAKQTQDMLDNIAKGSTARGTWAGMDVTVKGTDEGGVAVIEPVSFKSLMKL